MKILKYDLSNLSRQIWVRFREFIMLFLAVFCGFLAENYREQRQEEEVALGYLKSMLLDLERDSIQIDQMIRLTQSTYQYADSLRIELLRPEIKTNSLPAFRLLYKNFGFDDFAPNDGTIEQLKHSGSLRFIKEKEIVDALMDYQVAQLPLKIHESSMNALLNDVVKLRQNFDLIRMANRHSAEKIPLLKKDAETLNTFYERIEIWQMYMGRLEILQQNIRKKGQNLKQVILNFYPDIRLLT